MSTIAYGAHDPTQPANLSMLNVGMPVSDWQLQTTIISSNRKLAIINNMIVHEDDLINGIVIERIKKDAVDINTPEGKRTLFLLDANKNNFLIVPHK
jgi:hypothetical protein